MMSSVFILITQWSESDATNVVLRGYLLGEVSVTAV